MGMVCDGLGDGTAKMTFGEAATEAAGNDHLQTRAEPPTPSCRNLTIVRWKWNDECRLMVAVMPFVVVRGAIEQISSHSRLLNQ